jgi:hypothetical protein
VDQLLTMKVFVRVAQRTGFAAAARDLTTRSGSVAVEMDSFHGAK